MKSIRLRYGRHTLLSTIQALYLLSRPPIETNALPDSFSGGHEITSHLCNAKVNFLAYKSQAQDSILFMANAIQNLTLIHCSTDLPPAPAPKT